MKLIVGLGNPGKEYEKTRHNVGYMVLQRFCEKESIQFTKTQFTGKYAEAYIEGEKCIFLLPEKYMNLSGEVVADFIKYYKINIDDILIISDDLDMPVAKMKLKPSGSSGGHNGLKNIELHLNTDHYKRLKIGIANNKNIDTKDYVLGKFTKEEYEKLSSSIETATNIIRDFINQPFDKVMNKYNSKV